MNYKSYFNSQYTAISLCPDSDSYPPSSKEVILDMESLNVMFPINEETGHVVDLLTRLLNTNNELERNQLMQYLQDNSTSSVFSKLDDDTKLQLLKPRSLQSLGELAEYSNVLKNAIKEFNEPNDPVTSDPSTSDPSTSDPATSDPSTSDPASAT